MSAVSECGTNEQGAVPGRGVREGRAPRFRCDTHHPITEPRRPSRLSRDLLRGHVRELPDLSVLHEGMEGLVALSNKYVSWPMTTIERWRDRVQIGDREFGTRTRRRTRSTSSAPSFESCHTWSWWNRYARAIFRGPERCSTPKCAPRGFSVVWQWQGQVSRSKERPWQSAERVGLQRYCEAKAWRGDRKHS